MFRRLRAAALLAAPLNLWAATAHLELDGYQTGVVVPRGDGSEIVIGASGRLAPNPTTTDPHLFLMNVATRSLQVVSTLDGEADPIYDLRGGADWLTPSRNFDRFAFTSGTTLAGQGGGGSAVWIKDRGGSLTLVTKTPTGELPQAIGYVSRVESFDASGRYLTFSSNAPDLVPGDTNGLVDVFLYDTQTKQLSRVSLTHDGHQAPEGGWYSSISPDGTAVAFVSSSALLPGDTNKAPDFYLWDVRTRTLQLISRGPQGELSNGVNPKRGVWSDDGRLFSFMFMEFQPFKVDGDQARSVLYERATGRLLSLRAFVGDTLDERFEAASTRADVMQISAGGRYMLLAGSVLPVPYGKTGWGGVFLVDLQTRQIARVDSLEDGTLPSATTDGAWLVGETGRVLFLNRSPELGTTPSTVVHEWQASRPTRLQVSIEGPRGAIPPGTTPRYTVRITNDGTETVDDLVMRRYVQAGLAGYDTATLCASTCAFPPLAPGASISLSFDVTPQAPDFAADPTLRVRFDVRAQSLSRFDQTPADNIVAIDAAVGSSSGNGSGDSGTGGGGGAVDLLFPALMLLAGLRRRARGHLPTRVASSLAAT